MITITLLHSLPVAMERNEITQRRYMIVKFGFTHWNSSDIFTVGVIVGVSRHIAFFYIILVGSEILQRIQIVILFVCILSFRCCQKYQCTTAWRFANT